MNAPPTVTIIDYGMGNLWSVQSAFEYLDCSVTVTSDPETIVKSDRVVLPGVGSFKAAMETLRRTGIAESIIELVTIRGVNILGICLGMQLLGSGSPEDGETNGLGFIDGRTDTFDFRLAKVIKVPHIGFDIVRFGEGTKLFRGMSEESDFYFVHEYRMKTVRDVNTVSLCTYGEDFVAAFERNNIFATQFHPEKSQANGLRVLKNFLEIESC
jgi:imidazole glycerol-phosphate synthase subunit HisH